ncbi:MAG: hypothetical protein A2X86_03295 [Bdellovibrionales bacterium GWA2_49_15]|nr:MAG: hypothetical protein A2X86_03295 [Bdellovibrionales bacterium GWA2_49_15]HAZ12240.1 hypothetical protein [Bdellovibrionales bacterium]
MSFLKSFTHRFALEPRIRLFVFPLILGWIFTTWILIFQNYLVWKTGQEVNNGSDPMSVLLVKMQEIESERNKLTEALAKGAPKREIETDRLQVGYKLNAATQMITEHAAHMRASASRSATFSKWLIAFCLVVFVFFGTIIAAFSWYVVRDLTLQVTAVSNELSGITSVTTTSAQEVSDASSALSSGVTQQAAALQETVASLEEVRAMVNKNADNAQKAQSVAVESTQASQKGKEAVTEMIGAMGEIQVGNEAIQTQVETSNSELTEITKVIFEIANKTKIINDIVFQTKLLSFNASVEAARAGEHGKGFAVVAEEIGNLAQMSGSAAKDIGQLVDGSIKKVDRIIKDTKSKVSNLVLAGKEKVDAGTMTARRCNDVLDSILKNVEDMNQMIGEMSTASSEQARGVDEISKAMNQVEIVTQGNSAAANQATTIAHQLNEQAVKMGHHVVALQSITNGTKGARHASDSGDHSDDDSEHGGKVLPMGSRKESKEKTVEGTAYKRAIGAENPPSENDPRFEDV